jgi:hypothetical protein
LNCCWHPRWGDGNGDDGRPSLAGMALLESTYKKEAVPPLAARLAGQSANTAAARLIAPTLVRIGDATAAKVVVGWLETVGSSAEPSVRDLVLRNTRTGPMREAWGAALDPKVPFRDEQIREAIRDALDRYERDRGFNRVRPVRASPSSEPK